MSTAGLSTVGMLHAYDQNYDKGESMRILRMWIPAVVALTISAPLQLAAAEGRQVVSAQVAPILKSAQAAINQKNYSLALEELKKTDGMATTEFDQYVISQLRIFATAKLNPPPKP